MQHKVIIANLSDPATSQVFQMINDWTVSSLLEQSTWLDVSKQDDVRVLTQTGSMLMTANQWASSTFDAGDSLQLFTLQLLRDAKGALGISAVETAISRHILFQNSYPELINVVVPVHDLADAPSASIFDYRLNVVVSPVESDAPTSGVNYVSKKSEDVFSHAAAALASTTGLWRGQPDSPATRILSLGRPGIGQNTVISRSFVRYIDATELVGELVGSVDLDQSGMLPPSNDISGNPIESLPAGQDQIEVNRTFDSFLEQNRAALLYQGPRRFKPESLTEITFMEAVKLYFAFVFKWLWAAPGDYVRSKIDSFKVQVAKLGQQMLGADSQFDVIFKGTSSRTHDSSVEVNLSDEILDAVRIGLKGSVTPAPTDPSNLWFSMTKVATALADGGDSFGDIQLPTVGSKRVSVLNPLLITPNSQTDHFDVPAGLPIGVSGVRLRSDDPYSAFVALDQAEKASAGSSALNAVIFASLSKLKTDLRVWIEGNTSFVWKIGAHLASQLNGARSVAQDLQRMITEVDEQDFNRMAEAELKARRALARTFFGGLGMLALGGLIWLGQAFALYLINKSWPGALDSNWGLIAAVFVAIFLIWNIVSILIFNGKVGELFNLQRKLREQEARREWAEKNKQLLLLELHRLASLYSQYRLWAKAISPLFHREAIAPAGKQAAKTAISQISDLPASVVVATLSPSTAARQQILDQVHRSYFSKGWLMEIFETFIKERGFDPSTIWQDTGFGVNSPLVRLANSANEKESLLILAKLGDSSAKALVASPEAIDQWTVQVVSGSRQTEVSADQFFAALRSGAKSIPTASLLTERAAINDVGRVSRASSYFAIDSRLPNSSDVENVGSLTPSSETNRNLDLVAVRVEFSELIGSNDFAFLSQESTAPAPEAIPLIDQNGIEG